MIRALRYVLVGLFFATMVESINMGILGGNWVGMASTILLVYSVFVFLGYLLRNVNPWAHLAVTGLVGLVGIEWLLIGTAPGAGGSLLSTLIFQVGMFLYWATVGFGPRLMLDETSGSEVVRRGFIRFYIAWFAVVYLVGLLALGGGARFVFMQVGSALGHILLARFYLSYLRS